MMSRQEAAVAVALGWLGTPYRHQASRRGVGCDCLGLVRGIWRDLYGTEPAPVPAYARTPRDHAGAAELLRAAERYFVPVSGFEPQPGVLALFRLSTRLPPRHCGVFVSSGRFVHAQERLGVVEAPFDAGWRRRLFGLYRFPENA